MRVHVVFILVHVRPWDCTMMQGMLQPMYRYMCTVNDLNSRDALPLPLYDVDHIPRDGT